MIQPKWNIEAVKAYETGQGVELLNDPYPHYVPKNPIKGISKQLRDNT
jgi:hypothetical protein